MTSTRTANLRSDVWGSHDFGNSVTSTRDEWNPWPGRQFRVSVSISEHTDIAETLRDIAEVLQPWVLRGAPVSSRAAAAMAAMRVSGSDFAHFEADEWLSRRLEDSPSNPASIPRTEHEIPMHQRLADEVRQMTGLPTASLASALGVTREQYQRWLRGSPISSVRHGQLIYTHTIAAEVARKLGAEQGPLWWRTPGAGGVTPEDRLRSRMLDEVHRLVVAIPDEAPMAGGIWVALAHQEPLVDEGADLDPEDDLVPWSPYSEQADGDRG